MSFPLVPSKRPYDRDLTESNGKGKLQKSTGFYSQNQSLKVSPGTAIFRVLCPASRTGCIIGKGGSVISQIRQESNAKVRVEDTVPGCDERIIVIKGPDKETDVTVDPGKDDGEETNATKVLDDDKGHNEEDEKGRDKDDGDKKSDQGGDLQTANRTGSAQKALFLVFERMVDGDAATDGENEENSKSTNYVARLLVLSSQVGCILGKGGSVIKQMSSESGAQIRVLPREKLPACASVSDELLQITGGVNEAKKALRLVSQQLLESPPRDSDTFPVSSSGPSSQLLGPSNSRPELFPPPSFPYAGPREGADYYSASGPLTPKFHESGVPGRLRPPQDTLTFRLLCHADKVGSVIGKGGNIIKTVQLETGCDIKVLEGIAGLEDRIIVISGPAHPHDRISAAQEGLMRVQSRLFKSGTDNFEKTVLARLLVASSQIGCLLGMGGAIIAEMRKVTGSHIRIMGKEQVPKCASENEEVVQISGDVGTVQEALLQISSRLCHHHFFRDRFPSTNLPQNPAFPDQVPPFPSYMRRERSPAGMYPNLGLPFPKFDIDGLPPRGFHAPDDQPPFMHMHRPVVPPFSDRKQWGPQGLNEGGGPMGLPEYSGGPQRRMAGFGGGGQSAIITNTTVDVVVPRNIVPVIYGEEGESLKQICQISDAKVTIAEAKPGAIETVITISGTPEQTHAAQSLIQAFVICGPDSP